ncbi:MAG: TRAP transporter small permease subunit [Hyphomicrobiaceae bacterium]
MNGLLSLARRTHRFLEMLANASMWLLIVLMCVTCFDVVCRKLAPVYPDTFAFIPYSKLQELEWHIHTALFSFWMGYNYVINAHPRVDSYVENLSLRKRAWIELTGILLFAIPYTCVVIYYGWDFWWQSWISNEVSDAALGLSHRWIIKGVYFIGLWLVLLGILTVLIRIVAFLFGGVSAADADIRLDHVKVDV